MYRFGILALIATLLLAPNGEAREKRKATSPSGSTAAPTSEETASDEKAPEKPEKTERRSARRRATDSKSSPDVSELIDKLDYPELQVVPLASERLRMEARDEQSSWFYTHWQLQLSGLATLVTSVQAKNQPREGLTAQETSDANSVATIGQAVGIGWVAAGVFIGLQRPYRSGIAAIQKLDPKDPRSLLLRERLAEEALEKPARLMGPVRWASVLTNFGMNAFMGYNMTDKGRVTAGISAILAFLPLIYDDHAVRVYEKHLEYKTKIYGPVTSVAPIYDPQARTLIPAARLTWAF